PGTLQVPAPRPLRRGAAQDRHRQDPALPVAHARRIAVAHRLPVTPEVGCPGSLGRHEQRAAERLLHRSATVVCRWRGFPGSNIDEGPVSGVRCPVSGHKVRTPDIYGTRYRRARCQTAVIVGFAMADIVVFNLLIPCTENAT